MKRAVIGVQECMHALLCVSVGRATDELRKVVRPMPRAIQRRHPQGVALEHATLARAFGARKLVVAVTCMAAVEESAAKVRVAWS